MLKENGPRRVSPFFIPSALINLASGQVSIKYGFKGPNHSVVTACATGAHALGDAARLIQLERRRRHGGGRRRGRDLPPRHRRLQRLHARCRPASTTRRPQASRPWDKGRDGFVMGEGAGVVVLEEYEHAKKRGAKIYAEVMGYGLSGDAYHITAPSEDGDGALPRHEGGAEARQAQHRPDRLRQRPRHLDAMGDEIELGRGQDDCSARTPTSSPCRRPSRRSAICWAPPARSKPSSRSRRSSNRRFRRRSISTSPTRAATSTSCAKQAKQRKVRYALSNSFGFGGTNASLIFGPV